MISIGIDAIAMYTPHYYLPLNTLAKARNVDPDKFQIGLGQQAMAQVAPNEDIVTMAANAAKQVLQEIDLQQIDLLLFATESSIDQSKAAGLYVHELLGLPSHCRVVEMKQACYAATAALQLALPYVRENPQQKILIIAADIARYGLETVGESSQGAAAVALLISAFPRLIAIEKENGVATESHMDFWRPNYKHEAIVDGKFSSKLYLTMLAKSWQHYISKSNRTWQDHDFFCYHAPVPRLVEKAHQYLHKIATGSANTNLDQVNPALIYTRQIGNGYTASLYLGLISLLENVEENLAGKRIGFYSYGSGAIAEYFSGVVQNNYQSYLNKSYHQKLLIERLELSYALYEKFYQFAYVEDGSLQNIPAYKTGDFCLAYLKDHQRIYQKVTPEQKYILQLNEKELFQQTTPSESIKKLPIFSLPSTEKTKYLENNKILKIAAPGKIILSGEHAVVYGQPALALAINRYVTATVTRETKVSKKISAADATEHHILFDLIDLAHRSTLSFSALRELKNKIKHKYQRFVRGEYSIREVLNKPFELAQVALGLFTEALQIPLPYGVKVHVKSDIPIGCGMGSSAATIVSVLQAVSSYLNLPLTAEALFKLALEAENMQHGYSSGLDLQVAMQGGCLYMQDQHIESRTTPPFSLFLVHTGTPQSTTGQCVTSAAKYFTPALLDEFAAVTKAMDKALSDQTYVAMQNAIRANHQLLTRIGVVPKQVNHFINDIELAQGAAKICGAGTIAGESAGAVLVALDDQSVIETLCAQYAYSVSPLLVETRGLHAA